MKVQRQLIAYSDHPYWEEIHCPVRIVDDNGKVIYEDSYKEERVVKINKLNTRSQTKR